MVWLLSQPIIPLSSLFRATAGLTHLDDDRHDGVDDGHRRRHDRCRDDGGRLGDPGHGLQLLRKAASHVVGLGREEDDRRPSGHLKTKHKKKETKTEHGVGCHRIPWILKSSCVDIIVCGSDGRFVLRSSVGEEHVGYSPPARLSGDQKEQDHPPSAATSETCFSV